MFYFCIKLTFCSRTGKTGGFALPILQSLKKNPQQNYALVLAPTREFAIQIAGYFTALESCTDLTLSVIIGGVDIAKRPHVIIAT
jgi:superfamily II DNA/RNA helicase